MATLKNVISARVDDAEDGISAIADATRRRARRTRKRLQRATADGQELAGNLLDDGVATFRSAGKLIRERPLATAATMIVGGLLVGGLIVFLRRR